MKQTENHLLGTYRDDTLPIANYLGCTIWPDKHGLWQYAVKGKDPVTTGFESELAAAHHFLDDYHVHEGKIREAAPKMAEALKNLILSIEDEGLEELPWFREKIKLARAALAKAGVS